MSEEIKLHSLIDKFLKKLDFPEDINLKSKKTNISLSNHPGLYNFYYNDEDISEISNLLKYFYRNNKYTKDDVKNDLLNLFSEKNFYGAYCELKTYSWLKSKGVKYTPQEKVESKNVVNSNDIVIDGICDRNNIYFDIKAFGVQENTKKVFREKLEDHLPNYNISINGPLDNSYNKVRKFALEKIENIRSTLEKNKNYRIEELGWNISLKEKNRVYTESVGSFNCYRFGKENKYFLVKNSSQFTIDDPFILICSFHQGINRTLVENFNESTCTSLRALARRVFVGFNKEKFISVNASEFDSKIDEDYSISDVAKLLAGVLFIDLQNDRSWFFINPNSTHKFNSQKVNQMFNFENKEIIIDDFYYDNY